MLLDRDTQIKVEEFRKYAAFLSDKFDIEIKLESAKAETNGKTIFLPNILGMNEEEVEFLASILLHEVGHVVHSVFTEENFAKIKNESHFQIINKIEDARIENKIIIDYDGAEAIFSRLYNDFALNNKMMEKVFGGNISNSPQWFLITCYVHDKIVNLNKKFSFLKTIKTDPRKKLLKWIKINKIDELIESSPLKNWDDVMALGNKIYDLYFKNHKDESESNDIGNLRDMISKAMSSGFTKMEQDAKDMQKVLDKKATSIHAKSAVLDEMVKEKEKFRKSIRPKLDEIRAEQKDLAETIKLKKVAAAKDKKIHSAQSKLNAKREKQSDIQSKMDEAARDLADEEDEKKQEKIKNKIDKLDAKKDKLNPSINRLKKKIEEYQKLLKDAEKQLQEMPDNLTEQSREDLIDQFKENIEKKREMSDELDKRDQQISSKNMEIHHAVEDYHSTKLEAGKQIANKMDNLEKSLNKGGVPTDIMPKFEKNDDWADGDKEQKDFDKDASKESGDVVCNGAGFSNQNTRDILALIDKTKNDLESIDLAKHFMEKNKMSKLESFNTISEITNTEIVESDEDVELVARKHVPFTTQLDTVTYQNVSDGKELEKIKAKHATTISKVKNIFRQRFKFTKKDRFRGNKEEGGLDARNLWKLATKQDDNRIFEINDPKFVNKIKASVVVDISGSQDKEYTGNGQKLREMALFISEGLNDCFIKHEVTGFHAPISHDMRKINKSDVYNRTANRLETVVYKKFDDLRNKGIQNMKPLCSDNSDGESLRIIGKRLIKESSRRKIMFIMTDGKPFLSESNLGMLDYDLKEALKWLALNKVEVYAFGFNAKGKEFYGDRFCHIKKYDDMIDFCSKRLA